MLPLQIFWEPSFFDVCNAMCMFSDNSPREPHALLRGHWSFPKKNFWFEWPKLKIAEKKKNMTDSLSFSRQPIPEQAKMRLKSIYQG